MKGDKQLELARKKIGKIVRVTRKQLGLSQEAVARSLLLKQSALSRIESGQQELSAGDLVTFCKLTAVPIESFFSGYVEMMAPAVLKDDLREHGFKLPLRYANERGSKVRAVLPFLNYFESAFGTKKLHEYIRAKGIDADFFVNLDNQISLNFLLDISSDLIAKGAIKPREIHKIAEPVNQGAFHGMLHHQYDHLRDTRFLLETLISNAKYYECNFQYELLDLKPASFEISVTPEKHVPPLLARNDSDMGQLLCHYKKSYFRRFTAYGERRQAAVSDVSCFFKGDSKCVYHVKVAS